MARLRPKNAVQQTGFPSKTGLPFPDPQDSDPTPDLPPYRGRFSLCGEFPGISAGQSQKSAGPEGVFGHKKTRGVGPRGMVASCRTADP